MSVDWIVPPMRRAAAAASSFLRQTGRDRRRFFRVPVRLEGRLLAADGQEYPCTTLDASPGSIRVASAAPLGIGQQVVLYCEDIGRVTGRVQRQTPDGSFGIELETTAHKREKLAEILVWIINGRERRAVEDRRTPRVPASGLVTAELSDGRLVQVELLDMSMLGVAVKTTERPLIGSWVRLGQQIGRVARYIEGGFAIDFQPRGDGGDSADGRLDY